MTTNYDSGYIYVEFDENNEMKYYEIVNGVRIEYNMIDIDNELEIDDNYVPLLDFEREYEIFNQFPFIIRRIRGERVLEEIMKNNCPHVKLNGKLYKKHELIAKQFIPNPNNYKFVKHINHNKFDYHIDNLCWTNDSRCVRYTPSGIIY